MKNAKEREKEFFLKMKEKFGYKNLMQSPRLQKIVLNSGTGSIKDKEKIKIIEERMAKIAGQKPSKCAAKKSIASFKIRKGDVVGYRTTLRGGRMYNFFDRLIHIALPRTKDFRGISADSIDEMGNMSVAVIEHIVFPETADEELKDVFGLSVVIVTTARTKEEAKSFFEFLGVPFRKNKPIPACPTPARQNRPPGQAIRTSSGMSA